MSCVRNITEKKQNKIAKSISKKVCDLQSKIFRKNYTKFTGAVIHLVSELVNIF